jgi:hypothetical protein
MWYNINVNKKRRKQIMENIIFTPVESSNIISVGYDETTSSMYVKYPSGTYKYDGVDKSVYESLLTSTSKGRFMNENIKGQYNYSRV